MQLQKIAMNDATNYRSSSKLVNLWFYEILNFIKILNSNICREFWNTSNFLCKIRPTPIQYLRQVKTSPNHRTFQIIFKPPQFSFFSPWFFSACIRWPIYHTAICHTRRAVWGQYLPLLVNIIHGAHQFFDFSFPQQLFHDQ